MALIIEDGSIVANATSFATAQQIVDYALARGVTIEIADADVLAIKAMDYIAAQEHRMKGCRVSAEQALCYPRKGVYIYGVLFPYTAIPAILIAGQCSLAMAAVTINLMPTVDPANPAIKREKVGPLETEYFGGVNGPYSQPILTAADAILGPLFSGGRFSLRVDRA